MRITQFQRRMRSYGSTNFLASLTLSSRSVVENSPPGTLVGRVGRMRPGSTIALITDGDGRFELSNGAIVCGAMPPDFETAPSHTITVRETNPAFANSPHDTQITVDVVNVNEAPELRALEFSSTRVAQGQGVTIDVIGAAPGSAIEGQLPDGLVLNEQARTVSGTPTEPGSFSIVLTETLADSANSPNRSVIDLEVEEASASPAIIMAIIAGQSNSVGRNAIDTDPDPQSNRLDPDIFQFVGAAQQPDFRTLTNDIVQLDHDENFQRVGPGLEILYAIKDEHSDAGIVAVPCGRGSSGILNGSWLSDAVDGEGGYSFENMIDQTRRAIAAIQTRFPQATIIPRFYWVQGEQDSAEGRFYTDYRAALSDIIDRARSRIATTLGTIADPDEIAWIMGSMVPRKYSPEVPSGFNARYQPINRAHVDLSVTKRGVFYAQGPDQYIGNTTLDSAPGSQDNLHYQPHSFARELGRRMGTILTDAVGPNITNETAQGSEVDTKLAIKLLHDDAYGHATFLIAGGANAALFELSDSYAEPGRYVELRWASNGDGPAPGSYSVAVQAQDGAGNLGPLKELTVKVAAAYGVGDQGPVTVTSIYNEENFQSPYGGFTRPIPVRRGLNIFAFCGTGGGNRDSSFLLTVDGAEATKLIGNSAGNNFQVWSFISAVDKNAAIAVSFNGSGGKYAIIAAALTGSKTMPLSMALKPWSNQNGTNPYTASSLAVPAGAELICFAATNVAGKLVPQTPNIRGGLSAPDGLAALFTRSVDGAVQFSSGSYSGTASLVFERSE